MYAKISFLRYPQIFMLFLIPPHVYKLLTYPQNMCITTNNLLDRGFCFQ